MKKISLFLIFLKIGFYSFGGGYAVIPLIEENIITQRAWLTLNQFSQMITISQLTPGPLAVNIATFSGTIIDGGAGAAIATTATILPGLFITRTLIKLFKKRKEDIKIQNLLHALSLFGFTLICLASLQVLKIYKSKHDFSLPDLLFIIILSTFAASKKISTIQVLILGMVYALLTTFIHI